MLGKKPQLTVVLAGLVLMLGSFQQGCEVTLVMPEDDAGDTQVGGSDAGTDNTGGTGGTDVAGDSTGDDNEGIEPNPNSPCADGTNIYVSYVNESSYRIGFVENFRDASNQVVSGSMVLLDAAGGANSTRNKCITCPAQAGIRNIKYVQNAVETAVPYPADLMRGAFVCGDHITFLFQAGGVSTSVETP